ncbi:acetyltransferase (GNAT) domain-containing protein [Ditylenchus destructor]|uniref:Acetyltransferase (GNAT) domain-containing protein n=1 Tax=Ditylenchus destructor TaxID=166010 RepID=A0AAD4QVU9_9BILA|nr:acetyltransferase (GNAT) domain-containing protein [Ditylenchus destructor]
MAKVKCLLVGLRQYSSVASASARTAPGSESELSNWTKRQLPERKVLKGRYVILEPLDAGKHGEGLYQASTAEGAEGLFRYLPDHTPTSRAEFEKWLERSEASKDPLFFAVIEKTSGKVGGRQALQRIDPENGVIETGNKFWSPLISRRPAATEAQFLFMSYVFDDLGYRRLEWKCHADHDMAKRAAQRFGFVFEGIFRQNLVHKGQEKDTAWFSILDKDWPHLRAAYEKWLARENFYANGQQIRKLGEIRREMSAHFFRY